MRSHATSRATSASRSALAAAALITLSACGGGASGPKPPAATGTLQGSTTPSGRPDATDVVTSSTDPAAVASSAVTPQSSSRPRTQRPGPGQTSPGQTSPGQPAAYATGAAPGKYAYLVTGTQSGAIDLSPKPADGRSVMTVDPLLGTDQHSASVSDLPGQPPSEAVQRFVAQGVHLVDLKLGGGFKEFAPRPPVLTAPTAPGPQPWSWSVRSTDQTTTLTASLRYLGAETVTIGGTPVPAQVFQAELTFTGDIVGTVTATRWFSVAHSLDVKTRQVSDFSLPVRNGGDLTSVLTSLTPS